MASLRLIVLVIACTIAFVSAVPVGVAEPRAVAPIDQLAPLINPTAKPDGEKDLATASSYGYGYGYPYRPYGYYPSYYYGYPYRPYGYYYPYYRSYWGRWYY